MHHFLGHFLHYLKTFKLLCNEEKSGMALACNENYAFLLLLSILKGNSGIRFCLLFSKKDVFVSSSVATSASLVLGDSNVLPCHYIFMVTCLRKKF